MKGYPELTFFGPHRLDTYVMVRDNSAGFSPVPPRLIPLVPGSTVSFGLSYRTNASVKRVDQWDCNVTNLLLQLPFAPTATGDFSLGDRFNACHAGNVASVTVVENRATPKLHDS